LQKALDFLLAISYNIFASKNEGGVELSSSNSAEYYRKRRETIGQFSVPVSREKLNALTEKLKKEQKTKTRWLNEKIDEELSK